MTARVPLWKQRNNIAGIHDLESKGFNLEITHVPTSRYVSFPAFVENFSDAYTSEWGTEQVFGRMDPIATFSTTRRAISVAWIIPADSIERARENMERINILMQMLYPLYTAREGATTMNMGPLMRIKYLNLMQNSVDNEGLLGYVNGFTMDPLTEEGSFYGEAGGASPTIYPKTVRLNFELTVLHEHPVGFVKGEGMYTEYIRGVGTDAPTEYVFRGNENMMGRDSTTFPYDVRAPLVPRVETSEFDDFSQIRALAGDEPQRIPVTDANRDDLYVDTDPVTGRQFIRRRSEGAPPGASTQSRAKADKILKGNK